jgi:hypothetical protein
VIIIFKGPVVEKEFLTRVRAHLPHADSLLMLQALFYVDISLDMDLVFGVVFDRSREIVWPVKLLTQRRLRYRGQQDKET